MQKQAPIIIIDDDPLIRFMLATALEAHGLTSFEASSGEEGLRLFSEHGAQAVLLDVIMPGGKDGYETCAEFRIQEEGEHLPILMMTGMEDLDSINRAYEVGATDFITKPLNIPLLAYRLRYMLRASYTTKRLLDSESRLHHLAYFDPLTDLPNRQFFHEHLQQMIEIAKRHSMKLAVLFLDLDDFKRINDTLGHHVGDLVLQETANRLRKSIRASDMMFRNGTTQDGSTLARLGGDEFTLLLTLLEEGDDAGIIAERIRIQLSQPFVIEGQELVTNTSIGISVFPNDGNEASDLLKNADMAMYYAKRDGGNRYNFFSPNMTQTALRRLILENHLRKALAQGELSIHYQPQLDIASKEFTGLEALLRWHSHELGEILPAEFIPLAEDTGLIINIGEWVLKESCRQTKQWLDSGLPIARIGVNISAVQFLQADFPHLIAKILEETRLEPSILELELSEHTLFTTPKNLQKVLQDLKNIGVKLAIDDFGGVSSSLTKLRDYPIDRLKMDQSFLGNLELDYKNGAIASAVITLSNNLGINITAKGVETNRQLTFLKEKACTEAQGFLLCPQLPANQIADFLSKPHQEITNLLKPV